MTEPERSPPDPADTPSVSAPRTRKRLARAADVIGVLAGIVPGALCVLSSDGNEDFAHDAALVRITSSGATGLFRALDPFAFGPFLLLPLGTRALRASLGSAVFAAIAGYALFRIGRALLDRCIGERWHCVYLALIGSLTATLSAPWLFEGSAPAGSTLGALLALTPLTLLSLAPVEKMQTARFAQVAASLGLALFYEPLVGLVAVAGAMPFAANAMLSKTAWKTRALPFVIAASIGALPPAFVALREKWAAVPRVASIFAEPWGEAARAGAGSAPQLYRAEIGLVLAALVALGVALAVRKAAARTIGLSLGLVVLAAAASSALGAPSEMPRFGPSVLAGFGAAGVLAAVGLAHLVDFVSNAKIPFAKASAAMIVVFELVLPVRQGDDSLSRRDARSPLASSLVQAAMWGGLEPGTAVVIADREKLLYALAADANGELRSDLLLAPTLDLETLLARRALSVEPVLAGVYRDVALGGRPEEFALSELSRARPLALAFDPQWDRALARHLVSAGIATVFDAEPRGASDRIERIEKFTFLRQRLAQHLLPHDRDRERLHVVVKLLRLRAIALGAGGERPVLSKALDDLRAFSPEDPIADKLTRRIVSAHGPIEVRDLSP